MAVDLSGIKFEAKVDMGGSRSYSKWAEVENIEVKPWSTRDGSTRRAYVTAEVTSGTKSQRGRYTLGWIDGNGNTGGQNRGQDFIWGDATDEVKQAILGAAAEVLADNQGGA